MWKTIAGCLAVLITVGTTLAGLDSFYARRGWTEAQFQQYDQRFAGMRLNEVDNQIVQLENERRRRRLSPIEEDLLRRLYGERKMLCVQLRIDRC